MVYLFFFQAEDGIRYHCVTGVQTCALPIYSLGNVISLQIWERVREAIPDLDEQFERGEFAPLREWLGENVHRYGRKFTPQETLQRVAGSPLDAGPYLRYLKDKVTELTGAAA